MPTYSSYTGADIISVLRFPDFLNRDSLVFGELQTISYSTYRDKFPVRSLGYVNPKGYTKAGRTIAGTLIFVMFNEPVINKFINELYKKKYYNLVPDELPPFSIDITFANEYGATTKQSVIGIQITEGNQIMTIDQLTISEQFSFVAQDLKQIDRNYENDKMSQELENSGNYQP